MKAAHQYGKARLFTYDMEAKSVITFPSGGQALPGPGLYELTGLAWSGRGFQILVREEDAALARDILAPDHPAGDDSETEDSEARP